MECHQTTNSMTPTTTTITTTIKTTMTTKLAMMTTPALTSFNPQPM